MVGFYVYALKWHDHSVRHMWRYQNALVGNIINVHGYIKDGGDNHYSIMDESCHAQYFVILDGLAENKANFVSHIPRPTYPNPRPTLLKGQFKAKALRVNGSFGFNIIEVKSFEIIDTLQPESKVPIICKS
ncbi:hypothetical protein GCM10011273_32750 [Asticcacaulis endophyticus]|uniref:Uncharacterized protein n=1 Tax=Asticcacaulis endophyticus TaxID=1395890 RepID=A0A918QEU8_9CAUL|nr:hypothetical protein GCM10011273_32750 [Asticcacaulis endophyticus]